MTAGPASAVYFYIICEFSVTLWCIANVPAAAGPSARPDAMAGAHGNGTIGPARLHRPSQYPPPAIGRGPRSGGRPTVQWRHSGSTATRPRGRAAWPAPAPVRVSADIRAATRRMGGRGPGGRSDIDIGILKHV